MPQTPIILTRPADRINDMLDDLSDCHHPIHIAPLMTIKPADPMPDPNIDKGKGRDIDGVIISSRRVFEYAPDGFIQSYSSLPFYIVGDTTAEMARQQSLNIAATANTMADLLPSLPKGGNLIYLCGSHTRYDLAADHRVVYESRTVDSCPDILTQYSGQNAILPIYSRRTAEILARFVIQADLSARKWHFICISDALGPPLSQLNTDKITIAPDPTGDAMIKTIVRIDRR